jgi:microcystin-dependent protein
MSGPTRIGRRGFLRRALLALAGAGVAAAKPPRPAMADVQGIEPWLGEIAIFAGTFPPKGWAFCNGQILPINQNQALFSILGTTYGGDGTVNFALPNLRGRIPLQYGTAPFGIYNLGQVLGSTTSTLTAAELPAHTHTARARSAPGTLVFPAGAYPAGSAAPAYGVPADASMHGNATGSTGGSQAHSNMQPYLALHYIIALQGVYPLQ